MSKTKSNVKITEKDRIELHLNNNLYDKVKKSTRFNEVERMLKRLK